MFEYTPDTVPNTVIVIGAGGTGGRLIPLLAQFMKTMPWVIDPAIILVDDDIVEEKNLLRQNFIRTDVGKHKAVVLAERYSRAFGIEIIPVVKRITGSPSELTTMLENRPTNNSSFIIVMCVDSAKARRDILATTHRLNSYHKPFFIDAGNEDSYGQVTMFHPAVLYGGQSGRDTVPALQTYMDKWKLPPMMPCKVKVPYLYMDMEFYENLVDKPGGSCADLDQTLAINSMMATTIMGVIQNYYYVKPFSTNRINLAVAQGGSGSMTDMRNLHNITVPTDKTYATFAQTRRLAVEDFDNIMKLASRTYKDYMEDIQAKAIAKAVEEADAKAAAEAPEVEVQAEPVVVEQVSVTPVSVNSVDRLNQYREIISEVISGATVARNWVLDSTSAVPDDF